MTEEIKQPVVEPKVEAPKEPPKPVAEVKAETTKKHELQPYRKADYKEFVKFSAMPSIYRYEQYKFSTEQDFAKHYKLSQDTLTDWKNKESFSKDVDKQLHRWGSDKTPAVIEALFNSILEDGRAAEVKLWLQYIKQWKEGMVIDQNITNDNSLINILDKLDEPTRAKILEQLEKSQDERD